MRRLAFCAVFCWLGATAFCQSPAISLITDQAPLNKPLSVKPLFTFNGSDLSGHAVAVRRFRGDVSKCADAGRKYADWQNFHLPCIDPHAFAELTSLSLPLDRQWQEAKFEPIPTMWPNAKVEKIPTTWPKWKFLPVAAQKQGSTPAN